MEESSNSLGLSDILETNSLPLCGSSDLLSQNEISSDFIKTTNSNSNLLDNYSCSDVINTSQPGEKEQFFSDLTNLFNVPVTSFENALSEINKLRQTYLNDSKINYYMLSEFLNEFNDYFCVMTTSLRDALNYLQIFKKSPQYHNIQKKQSKEDGSPKDKENVNDDSDKNQEIIMLKAKINDLEHIIFQKVFIQTNKNKHINIYIYIYLYIRKYIINHWLNTSF